MPCFGDVASLAGNEAVETGGRARAHALVLPGGSELVVTGGTEMAFRLAAAPVGCSTTSETDSPVALTVSELSLDAPVGVEVTARINGSWAVDHNGEVPVWMDDLNSGDSFDFSSETMNVTVATTKHDLKDGNLYSLS